MNEVAHGGRTVLFVSHSLGAIENLTSKSLFIKQGGLVGYGATPDIIRSYFEDCAITNPAYQREALTHQTAEYSSTVEFTGFDFCPGASALVREDEALKFRIKVKGHADIPQFRFGLTVCNSEGFPVGTCFGPENCSVKKDEETVFEFVLNGHGLAQGSYFCSFSIGAGNKQGGEKNFDLISNVLNFEIVPSRTAENLKPHWSVGWGSIRLPEPEIRKTGK